jgi:uncharacterized repeat protein (TIGR02543 family)
VWEGSAWKQRRLSLIYDTNESTSGTVPVDANIYSEGDTVTVLNNTGTLAKTGNSFSGWNTAADGSGTDYSADDTFEIDAANVILYAQWTAI